MVVEGVDYSDARPSPSGLFAAGKRFVVRYGGPGRSSKHLTASELKALRAAGLDVVANAEGSAGGYKGGTAGSSWAYDAETDFRGLGMGADRPIYFSADWDVQPSEYASVDAALRGSASVIGVGRVGIYGSYDMIAHCVAAGTATWFWQTYAWSMWTNPTTGRREVRWHPKAHLQQYRNGVTVAGGDCDLNRAMTADYGQWNYQGADMPIDSNDAIKVWNTDTAVPMPTWDPRKATNDSIMASTAMSIAMDEAHAANVAATALKGQLTTLGNSLMTAITALAAKDQVDEVALGQALSEGVGAAVLAGLPEGMGDQISQEEVTTAVQVAFANAFAPKQ